MIYGLVIGTIVGLVTRMLLKRHMQRARARIFSMYLNPGYATALCAASRHAMTTQGLRESLNLSPWPAPPPIMTAEEAYKNWMETSEAHWNERAKERNEIVTWYGEQIFPAPEIFIQREVSDDGRDQD